MKLARNYQEIIGKKRTLLNTESCFIVIACKRFIYKPILPDEENFVSDWTLA